MNAPEIFNEESSWINAMMNNHQMHQYIHENNNVMYAEMLGFKKYFLPVAL